MSVKFYFVIIESKSRWRFVESALNSYPTSVILGNEPISPAIYIPNPTSVKVKRLRLFTGYKKGASAGVLGVTW